MNLIYSVWQIDSFPFGAPEVIVTARENFNYFDGSIGVLEFPLSSSTLPLSLCADHVAIYTKAVKCVL